MDETEQAKDYYMCVFLRKRSTGVVIQIAECSRASHADLNISGMFHTKRRRRLANIPKAIVFNVGWIRNQCLACSIIRDLQSKKNQQG
jgi:hypothetical protein